jgi:hypothetical protein
MPIIRDKPGSCKCSSWGSACSWPVFASTPVGRRRTSLFEQADVTRFVEPRCAVFGKQFHEAPDAAAFVGAQVEMDVPAEVIPQEPGVELRAFRDDLLERVEPEGAGFAQQTAERAQRWVAAQSPDRVDERQTGEFIPGGAQVPDRVIQGRELEVERGIADEQDRVWLMGVLVAGKGAECGLEAAFGQQDSQEMNAGEGCRIAMDLADLFKREALRVRAKITSGFGGSATGPAARREGGSVSIAILDRPSNAADGPVPPRPCGLGRFWLLASWFLSHRAKAMLLRLASPEAKIASSKTRSYFCTDPKGNSRCFPGRHRAGRFGRRRLAVSPGDRQ